MSLEEAKEANKDANESNANSGSKQLRIDELAEKYGVNQKKLMLKIDFCVIPPFCLLYFLSFLDRINISNAKLYGLSTSLNLEGNQFNTALTVFFVPYIFFEILSNYCIKLVKPHIWLSVCIFCFGVVTIGMGFTTNFGGLVACRFLLGLFESATFPAIFYILANFYTRNESQRRFSAFFSVVCLAGACGGALAYRIGVDLDGVHGISSWQYIFIIEGTFTAGLAFLLFFTITDFPEQASFLSQNERDFIKEKLAIASGTDSGFEIHNTLKDVINTLKSPIVWIPTFGYFCLIIPSYGYAYFAPTIISQMGYTGMEANRHSIYPWLVAFGYSNFFGYISDRTSKRMPFAVFSSLLAIVGLAITLGCKSNPQARYAGCFLSVTGLYTAMPLLVCWASLNFGGHARKGVGSGAMIGFGNIGGIISTWIFLSKDAPTYKPGLATSIAFTALSVFTMIGFQYYCRYQNNQKKSAAYLEKFDALSDEDKVKAGDLSPHFVYGY
ncbi:hypothetical protein PACTADRAFT_74385 [Pachysolen tannophilus NRRL Y-2460]|uniref:Major facilitator superfamily (MFS) profile domain-containing protein n=1 Tax=Pachysolen tannophilus NRRL Y-2460 TaxID=669874 RepID=A0A1E4TYD7_PACTA|nr:hypothetical protein PACTADRAFT_74385 [Pachysolen tannophilus NRRL Y-2460]